jgi:hypothetical protein
MNKHHTSATVIPFSAAVCRSTWSEPTPAVRESSSCFAFCRRSLVRYAGQKGVVMMMSVDGSSLSSSTPERGSSAEFSQGLGLTACLTHLCACLLPHLYTPSCM